MRLKNRISIISIICILFCSSIVFGMNQISNVEGKKLQDLAENATIDKKSSDGLDEYSDLIELLKKQGLDADELQYTIEHFFETTLIYPINEEELVTIKDLVNNGADLLKVLDIYMFLQNSNASLKYIKDMYYYGEDVEFYGRYWIEDAFNDCSGQKEYELSMEDVQKYIDNGMSTDDIRIANTISRSEVKNIQELLEEKQSGKVWGEIINEVYSEMNLSDMQYKEDGNAILASIRLSRISDEPINKIYDNYNQSPQKLTNDIIVPKIIEAENKVKELKLNVSDSIEYFNQLKADIGDSLSDDAIKDLIKQKYTKAEIKKAKIVSELNGIKIESVLEENKEINNLEVEGGYMDE